MSTDRPFRLHHASTELLSVYLDGRAEAHEATFLEQHLPSCDRCSDQLAGLGAVRDLLRRLPDVQPRRSFVLPDPLPARRSRSRGFWLIPSLQLWTRAAGAVAAVFFVLFLSLDVLGYGAEVPVPLTAQSHATAATSVPIRPPAAATPPSEAARPAEATRTTNDSAIAATARPDQARVGVQATQAAVQRAPPSSAPTSLAVSGPTVRPLQLLAAGTGIVALALLVSSVLVRRRRTG